MDVWNLIPNEGGEKVKAMLFERIKDEAVRVHLLKEGTNAYSQSASTICVMPLTWTLSPCVVL